MFQIMLFHISQIFGPLPKIYFNQPFQFSLTIYYNKCQIINLKMSADKNSSGQQIQSQQSRDLTDLKRQIELSNLQLLELTHNDEKFTNHIHELNAKGVQCIENEEHKEAVIYFSECQKILEYAAGCGKTIDRSIIVVTLHNQACVNQKLWDLQKSANYLEGIIYNINIYFETLKKSQKYKEQLQQYCAFIHKKLLFGLYHLQFCAVNSQIRKHSISLSSAKSAIRIMRQVCNELFELSEKILYDDLNQINYARVNSSILKDLANSTEDLMINDYQKYFGIVKQLLGQKQRNKSVGEDQYKNVRSFSIGKLMQLTPITLSDMQSKQEAKDWVKSDNIITLSLYLGVCYFTVGTQLRFISSQNSEEGNQVYKLSEDFLISQVYHIYAIMMVLKNVPVRSIFLNHLLTSFNSHYEIDLQKVFASSQYQSIKNSKKLDRKQIESYSSSQQLHIIASSLPQESTIKGQPNFKSQQEIVSSARIPQTEQATTEKTKVSNIQKKSENSNRQKISLRSKSPNSNIVTEKSKKEASKSNRKRKSVNKQQNFKSETFIHLNRRIEGSKHENSMKNNISKTKSDFHRSSSSKKKKEQKMCIYTTKQRRDICLEKSKDQKTVSKKKQKKSPSKQIKQRNRNIQTEIKKKSSRKQKEKSKSKSKSRSNGKQKQQKKSTRNVIGKVVKKTQIVTGFARENQAKSKTKFKREKFKMNRVEGIKH